MKHILILILAAALLLSIPQTAAAVYYEDTQTDSDGSSVYYEETIEPFGAGEQANFYDDTASGIFGDAYFPENAPTEDVSGEGNAFLAGDAIEWYLEGSTLYISGQGDMYDFPNGGPWAQYKNAISRVVISGGVTSVGAYAFHDFDGLYSVDFGSSITQVGAGAFYSCDGLTSISLPATFKKFGADCFRSCANLKEIYCSGGFPRFDENCLWDTGCTIYYSASNPWAVSLIEQLETAFHNRIEFRSSDGTDPYVPTEAVLPTQPVYIPETTAPTEAPIFYPQPTQPVPVQTVPPTAPSTLPTEPEPTAPRETFLLSAEPTRPMEPARGRGTDGNSVIGVLIIMLTLAIIATASLLFHVTNRRGSGKKRRKGRR